MGFVGAAVDYSRANSVKAAMQAAVGATALMLSKEASSSTSAQINQKATNYSKLCSISKNLLTQLKNATTQNGDVYGSIIPFS